jgi:hypothetical protein
MHTFETLRNWLPSRGARRDGDAGVREGETGAQRQLATAARERGTATGFVSDFTRFIDGFLEEHPEVVADQRAGRAIYWDRPVDLKQLEAERRDTVPTDSYYYFGNPWPRQ